MILFLALALLLSLHLVSSGGQSDCSEVFLTDIDAVEKSLNLSVVCGDNFTVEISTCILERMGYDPEKDISVNGLAAEDPFDGGKICIIQEERDGDILRMTFGVNECNTEGEISEGYITYYNVVRNVGFSNVNGDEYVRRRNIHLPFSCFYRTHHEESGLGPIDTQINEVNLEVEEQSGQLEAVLLLCVDSDCDEGYPSNNNSGVDIPVLQVVCLVIKIAFPMKVQIYRVWATTTEDPSDEPQLTFYEDGCILDPFVTDVATNTDYVAFLSFPMFHWTHDPLSPIYFHAVFDICDEELEECATPVCGGDAEKRRRRRRRSSSMRENRRTLTIGPYIPME